MSETVVSGPATHPLADLIPAMGDEAYAELRDDVAAHGLHQPIVLFEHMVLDGRHRLRACQDTATPMRFEEYDGDEPAAHVLSLNLHRRHLSVSQRAMVAAEFLPHLRQEFECRRGANLRTAARDEAGRVKPCTSPKEEVQDKSRASGFRAAQRAGVSPASVERARVVLEAAPDLAEDVRNGSVTVTAAYGEAVERRTPSPTTATAEENGRLASARSIQRIAAQAGALAMALDAFPIVKSCARLSEAERTEALQSCKKGLKALNALANALGR